MQMRHLPKAVVDAVSLTFPFVEVRGRTNKTVRICEKRLPCRASWSPKPHVPRTERSSPKSEIGALPGARTEPWRQRLVKLTLVFSDVMLALLVWEVACLVKVLLSPGSLSGAAGASIVPITLLWVCVRAMQGLYASCYGLD